MQAPHMALGQWVSVNDFQALAGRELARHLEQSYRLMLGGLSKKLQREILGEEPDFS